jgi:hypothetical protein
MSWLGCCETGDSQRGREAVNTEAEGFTAFGSRYQTTGKHTVD